MDEREALRRLAGCAVARLATVKPDGRPRLVPITFAVVEHTVVTAIDQKPKTTRNLARLDDIAAKREVAVLADHYEDEWEQLWWVRVDGTAATVADPADRARAIDALTVKYPQYRIAPPDGVVITVAIERVSSWAWTGG